MKSMLDFNEDQKKNLYLYVIKNYKSKSNTELARENDLPTHVINGICSRIRKVGVQLPKRNFGFLTPAFIEQLKSEWLKI